MLPALATRNLLERPSAAAISSGFPYILVQDYAVSDGKIVYDAAMNNGSAILTSASGRFSSTDAGKAILVLGAGAAGVAGSGTVVSFQSVNQLTLSFTNASGGNIAGKKAWWGTDNTAGIQAAVNKAKIGIANTGNATIVFGNLSGSNATYLISDTIDFGADFDGGLITSFGFGYVNPDIAADGTTYQNVSIRWVGPDGTGKPKFWFKNGCSFNRVENLGFYGGEESVRFRATSTPSSINYNTVRNCQFDAEAVAGIMIGWPLADGASDNDMAGYLVDRCFFYSSKVGVAANSLNNGYGLKIRDSGFYNGFYTGAQALLVNNWNNIDLENVIISGQGGTGAPNGLYPIQRTGASNSGYLNINGLLSELPLVVKATMGGFSTRGVKIENLSVNTTVVDAKEAVDITGFVTAINSTVSTNAVQRTWKASAGGVAIGNVTSGAAADLFTGGKWIIMGLLTGSVSRPIQLAYQAFLSALDSGGVPRQLFGISADYLYFDVNGDLNGMIVGAKSFNLSHAAVAGIATLVAGTVTVNSTAVTANSEILRSRRTPGGALGHLSIGAITPGVSFRIDSSSGTETSTVSWVVVN